TKDDYEAVFYSKDSEYEPYLELVVNGMTERLKPTKDAYVAAGEFSDENYGYDEFLRCRESGVGEEEPVNSETRRSFLVFDLSAYDAGDTISSAVLYLKGRWEDKSENIRNDDSYEKKLVAISDMKDNWAEDTFTFKTNSTVIFSYEGEFGTKWLQPNVPSNPDEVFESNLNRFSWMKTLTSVYKDTGDETYALAMFMYLHHFIETTYNKLRGQEGHENSKPTWPEGQDPYNTNEDLLHGGYSNSLDLSVRSYNIALNLIYYYDSENMTPELFSVFLKYMWSMGNVLSRFFGRSERAGNWGDYSNRGFYALMSYYPEFAATDEWMEIFLNRIDIKAKGLTLPDGSSEEGSISYTTTGFNYPFSNVTLAKKLGEQLIYSEKTMSKLTDLVKYCTNMILPWGGDPGFGDGNSHKGDYYSSLLNLVEWLGDPELLYVYTGGKKGTEPTWKSSYYDFRKMLTMRSGWNDDALYLYTTSSGSPYSHNHWDSLEIILAAYGEYLLIDPGYYSLAKDDLIHRWLQSSRAHNTIEINDTRQKKVIAPTAVNGADNALPRGGSKGDIIDVEFNDAYSFARVITENCKDLTYGCDPTLLSGGIAPPTEPGMDCHRDILFVNSKFYIVSDYMDPVVNTKENKYTQIWHTLPGKGLTIDGQYVLGAGESIGDLYSGDVDSQIENTHFVRGTGNGMLKTTDESGTNILIIPADIDNVEPKLLRGLYSHTKN
ncbi:MAG: heparinase II/III family protein, partial [Parabacteroides sp.]|nr:heparinase II/III family protein [Parabacteroides sp.]